MNPVSFRTLKTDLETATQGGCDPQTTVHSLTVRLIALTPRELSGIESVVKTQSRIAKTEADRSLVSTIQGMVASAKEGQTQMRYIQAARAFIGTEQFESALEEVNKVTLEALQSSSVLNIKREIAIAYRTAGKIQEAQDIEATLPVQEQAGAAADRPLTLNRALHEGLGYDSENPLVTALIKEILALKRLSPALDPEMEQLFAFLVAPHTYQDRDHEEIVTRLARQQECLRSRLYDIKRHIGQLPVGDHADLLVEMKVVEMELADCTRAYNSQRFLRETTRFMIALTAIIEKFEYLVFEPQLSSIVLPENVFQQLVSDLREIKDIPLMFLKAALSFDMAAIATAVSSVKHRFLSSFARFESMQETFYAHILPPATTILGIELEAQPHTFTELRQALEAVPCFSEQQAAVTAMQQALTAYTRNVGAAGSNNQRLQEIDALLNSLVLQDWSEMLIEMGFDATNPLDPHQAISPQLRATQESFFLEVLQKKMGIHLPPQSLQFSGASTIFVVQCMLCLKLLVNCMESCEDYFKSAIEQVQPRVAQRDASFPIGLHSLLSGPQGYSAQSLAGAFNGIFPQFSGKLEGTARTALDTPPQASVPRDALASLPQAPMDALTPESTGFNLSSLLAQFTSAAQGADTSGDDQDSEAGNCTIS